MSLQTRSAGSQEPPPTHCQFALELPERLQTEPAPHWDLLKLNFQLALEAQMISQDRTATQLVSSRTDHTASVPPLRVITRTAGKTELSSQLARACQTKLSEKPALPSPTLSFHTASELLLTQTTKDANGQREQPWFSCHHARANPWTRLSAPLAACLPTDGKVFEYLSN